jgi:hypothetical protein
VRGWVAVTAAAHPSKLSNEDAFGSDPVVNSAGTGSDHRMVPPFALAGDEATASIRAVAMIAKRNIAFPMYYPRRRATSRSHGNVAC